MQIARNVTMEEWAFLEPDHYLIHNRDSKYCGAFKQLLDGVEVRCVPLSPKSPWLKSYAEHWVRLVKDEALSRVILFGEGSLRHVLNEYVKHYHRERGHQGSGNAIPFPSSRPANDREGSIACRERLGGLLKYYYRKAA